MFYNLERHILKLALNCEEPKLDGFQFNKGDKVYAWKVVDRNEREIHMEWTTTQVGGTTWLYLPEGEDALYFGSSINKPSYTSSDGKKKESRHEKVERLTFRASVPIHKLYSKFLLDSTIKHHLRNQS